MLVDLNISNKSNQIKGSQNLLYKTNTAVIPLRRNAFSTLNKDRVELSKFKNTANVLSFGSNIHNSEFSVAAMAPLRINNDIEMAKFNNDLQFAKNNGVKAISVDVWWGMVQKDGLDKFDWSYYEKIFNTIKSKGLDIIPILSTHQCGGNVGDNVHIPIPDEAWNYVGEKLGIDIKIKDGDSEITKSIKKKLKEDLYYKNERGQHISEVVPIWYDEIIMPKYRKFAEEFKKHFIDTTDPNLNVRDNIKEMHVSCGPAGELRHSTYSENIKGAEFPSRGMFVGYDMGGKTAFRNYMMQKYDNNLDKLNKTWGTKLESFNEIMPPHNSPIEEGRAKGFIESKDYINTPYGRDFMDFYHNTLLKHGEDTMTMVHEVFKDTNIGIGIKIPGVNWQIANENTPRIAEKIAGILDRDITRENDFGYKTLFDMIKRVKDKYKNDTITCFTCLEMDNDLHGVSKEKPTNSCAEYLVSWIQEAASKRDLILKGENACEENLYSEKGWNMLKHNIWKGFDGITFLRVGVLNNNTNFHNFMNWVKTDLAQKAKQLLKAVA